MYRKKWDQTTVRPCPQSKNQASNPQDNEQSSKNLPINPVQLISFWRCEFNMDFWVGVLSVMSKHLGEEPRSEQVKPTSIGPETMRKLVLRIENDARRCAARAGTSTPVPRPQSRRKWKRPGIEEEPARAVHKKKAQVTPAIAPGAEVRRVAAAVGREGGGHLGDFHLQEAGLHDHFAGEFHAGGSQVHAPKLFAEGADAAMEICRANERKVGQRVSTGLPR